MVPPDPSRTRARDAPPGRLLLRHLVEAADPRHAARWQSSGATTAAVPYNGQVQVPLNMVDLSDDPFEAVPFVRLATTAWSTMSPKGAYFTR
jgi:hypothetical protein